MFITTCMMCSMFKFLSHNSVLSVSNRFVGIVFLSWKTIMSNHTKEYVSLKISSSPLPPLLVHSLNTFTLWRRHKGVKSTSVEAELLINRSCRFCSDLVALLYDIVCSLSAECIEHWISISSDIVFSLQEICLWYF